MRKQFRWFMLMAGLLLMPTVGYAQITNYEVPPVDFTGPFSHPRYEDGGFYVGSQFLYWSTNRILNGQSIAKRGFLDFDGSITQGNAGTFLGSGKEALNTDQLRGPGTHQPGWDLFIGWRFQNGVVVELDWKHLQQARYTAAAGLLDPSLNTGGLLQNTFLFAPVSNFSLDWAGNAQNVPQGDQGATFGIWNAASLMQIEFVQRFDLYQINVRVPIWETADHRTYGLFGPRIAWIWENFMWRTVDADQFGQSGPSTVARYNNMISNRMYGLHFGFGNDWFLGTTPIGAFALECEMEGSLYADLVKTQASWDREDRAVGTHRSRRLSALVPGLEARLGLKWYVWEGITIELGYDVMTFFNTIASQDPVDFNMGTLDPAYENIFIRWFHGIRCGITFVF